MSDHSRIGTRRVDRRCVRLKIALNGIIPASLAMWSLGTKGEITGTRSERVARYIVLTRAMNSFVKPAPGQEVMYAASVRRASLKLPVVFSFKYKELSHGSSLGWFVDFSTTIVEVVSIEGTVSVESDVTLSQRFVKTEFE